MTDTVIICQNHYIGQNILIHRIFENNRIPFFTIDFEKQEKKIRQENFDKMMQEKSRENFELIMSLSFPSLKSTTRSK